MVATKIYDHECNNAAVRGNFGDVSLSCQMSRRTRLESWPNILRQKANLLHNWPEYLAPFQAPELGGSRHTKVQKVPGLRISYKRNSTFGRSGAKKKRGVFFSCQGPQTLNGLSPAFLAAASTLYVMELPRKRSDGADLWLTLPLTCAPPPGRSTAWGDGAQPRRCFAPK